MRRWITAILTTTLAAGLVGAGSAAQAHTLSDDLDPIVSNGSESAPLDVWRHILAQMPPEQRLRTMHTDLKWFAVGSDPTLWQPEELAYLTDDQLEQLNKIKRLQGLIDIERTSRAITTIAGSGQGGYAGGGFAGDGGAATAALLHYPYGVTVDTAGNVYIADTGSNHIRKIDAAGTITTIAGNGQEGFAGDDGPATDARLHRPTGVAVDTAGNVYIADQSNHRIRKVDAAGTITTIAGIGQRGSAGDDGPAAAAQLSRPNGIAVDAAGNLYIADTGNRRIRKVDAATQNITTIAGSDQEGFAGDDGPATNARLKNPSRVTVDAAGNVYIADTDNSRIRKVDAATQTITTIAGNGQEGFAGDGGPATAAQLNNPRGVTVDAAGNLYIADTTGCRIRKIDAAGIITTIAGNGQHGLAGDDGPAAAAQMFYPTEVTVDTAGNVYIADQSNHRVRKFRPNR